MATDFWILYLRTIIPFFIHRIGSWSGHLPSHGRETSCTALHSTLYEQTTVYGEI